MQINRIHVLVFLNAVAITHYRYDDINIVVVVGKNVKRRHLTVLININFA